MLPSTHKGTARSTAHVCLLLSLGKRGGEVGAAVRSYREAVAM